MLTPRGATEEQITRGTTYVRIANGPTNRPPTGGKRQANRPTTNLASLAEDAVPVAQPIPGEPLHPRVHESIRVHHEGVEVDQGAAVLAPLPPAVVAVPREVDDLRLPLFRAVRHRLLENNNKIQEKDQAVWSGGASSDKATERTTRAYENNRVYSTHTKKTGHNNVAGCFDGPMATRGGTVRVERPLFSSPRHQNKGASKRKTSSESS